MTAEDYKKSISDMKDNISKLNELLNKSQTCQEEDKTLYRESFKLRENENDDLKQIIEEQKTKLYEYDTS